MNAFSLCKWPALTSLTFVLCVSLPLTNGGKCRPILRPISYDLEYPKYNKVVSLTSGAAHN
jgi:hypothetical protein